MILTVSIVLCVSFTAIWFCLSMLCFNSDKLYRLVQNITKDYPGDWDDFGFWGFIWVLAIFYLCFWFITIPISIVMFLVIFSLLKIAKFIDTIEIHKK